MLTLYVADTHLLALVCLCLSVQVNGDTFNMVYVSIFTEHTEMARPAIDIAIQDFYAAGGLQGHQVR